MTQKELADILGIEEKRIQECEKNNYQCASFV
jgi:DNA-binding XRE family transcriptional regulator